MRATVYGAMVAMTMTASAQAANLEAAVDYRVGDVAHRGYIYYDDANPRPRPLLLMVPNWLGVTEANRRQAQQIAGGDYVLFLADMFGRDHQPADAAAAGAKVRALSADRAVLRATAAAALDAARRVSVARQLPADLHRQAAIGFCFGGGTVLEMARAGLDLAAVVSFHGTLAIEGKADDAPIRARILALHGDADPVVPPAQVRAFEEEMRRKQPDWQLVSFGGAVHSFTDPEAHRPGQAMYDERSARRAFALMHAFLAEAFAAPP